MLILLLCTLLEKAEAQNGLSISVQMICRLLITVSNPVINGYTPEDGPEELSTNPHVVNPRDSDCVQRRSETRLFCLWSGIKYPRQDNVGSAFMYAFSQ
jgi:hypothetical protein